MMVGMRNFHKEKEMIPDSNFDCPKQTSLPRKTQQTRYIILKK